MQKNFLQSLEWIKFQEALGQKTFQIESEIFDAFIIEHSLPIVGKYFYIPRGPVLNEQKKLDKESFQKLLLLAKNNNIGWIRIEPITEKALTLIKEEIGDNKIQKSPQDIQPKETLIIDISKSEEELLSEMKSKTRYNIKLAQKKGVTIELAKKNDLQEFIRLTEIMAKRQRIKTHTENHYRKILEIIPPEMAKLYLAKYNNSVVAANIVIFFENTATYLHGASDDKYKNLMAPYLLQWRQIQDAKKQGYEKYDFFGVKVNNQTGKSWEGITKFKLGFSPNTSPVEFPGSYDIVINPWKYKLYKVLQFLKNIFK